MTSTLFSVTEERRDGAPRYLLAGSITEATDFSNLLLTPAERPVLDLSGIERINSCGVREWIHFLDRMKQSGKSVVLENCAVVMVRQFNMIDTVTKGAEIHSVLVPYFCAACDDERNVRMDLDRNAPLALPDSVKCPECQGAMEFDDSFEAYFAFQRRTH